MLAFSEFKRNFQALVEAQGYEDEVCLLYLRDALPKDLDYLMVGVTKMGVAWERLEDRYGDRQLRVRALYDKLLKVDLRGKEYERLERLHFEVENACVMAAQLGADQTPRKPTSAYYRSFWRLFQPTFMQ